MWKLKKLIMAFDIGITDHAMWAISYRFDGDVKWVIMKLQQNIETLAWCKKTDCYSIVCGDSYFIFNDNLLITAVKK